MEQEAPLWLSLCFGILFNFETETEKEMQAVLTIGVPARHGTAQLDVIVEQMKSHPVNEDYHVIVYVHVESNEWKFETHNLQGKEGITVEELAAEIKAADVDNEK